MPIGRRRLRLLYVGSGRQITDVVIGEGADAVVVTLLARGDEPDAMAEVAVVHALDIELEHRLAGRSVLDGAIGAEPHRRDDPHLRYRRLAAAQDPVAVPVVVPARIHRAGP